MTVSDAKKLCYMKEWNEMALAQKESGMTVKAWCQENNIAESTYNTRLRKLRKFMLQNMQGPQLLQDSMNASKDMPAINIAKVNLTSKVDRLHGGDISIHKNGAEIVFNQNVSPELIKFIITEVMHA